jgi:hypothetical protein
MASFQPITGVVYPTLKEYMQALLDMPPRRFAGELACLKRNIADAKVHPELVKAFELVTPTRLESLDVPTPERNAMLVRALTEEEKLVEAGTHEWACVAYQSGKGGSQNVRFVVPVGQSEE